MSKKKKSKFANSRLGGILGMVIIIAIVTAFVLSLLPRNTSSRDTEKEQAEFRDIQNSVSFVLNSPASPIIDLSDDHRVIGYAAAPNYATRDMTDGGLLDFVDDYLVSGSIIAVSDVLKVERTFYKYWIEPNGSVHQQVN